MDLGHRGMLRELMETVTNVLAERTVNMLDYLKASFRDNTRNSKLEVVYVFKHEHIDLFLREYTRMMNVSAWFGKELVHMVRVVANMTRLTKL